MVSQWQLFYVINFFKFLYVFICNLKAKLYLAHTGSMYSSIHLLYSFEMALNDTLCFFDYTLHSIRLSTFLELSTKRTKKILIFNE